MTTEERLQAIRDRLKRKSPVLPSKPKGQFLASNPDACPAHRMKWARELKRSKNKWRSSVYGLDLGMSQTGAQWTNVPDEKPKQPLRAKRGHKPHHLNKIAEEWASEEWREKTKRLDLYHA